MLRPPTHEVLTTREGGPEFSVVVRGGRCGVFVLGLLLPQPPAPSWVVPRLSVRSPQGLPEGGLVEGVGTGGLGGELGHLIHARLVGLPALGVIPLQETGLLAAMAAGAVQGLKESGYEHGYSVG